MSKMNEWSVETLLEKTESSAPHPGGGGISALTAAICVGLDRMVHAISVTGKKYKRLSEEDRADFDRAVQEMKEDQNRLMELAVEDGYAFQKVLDAMKLPKDTEEEKAERARAMEEGYLHAMSTPFEIAEIGVSLLKQQYQLAKWASPMAISDIAVATELLRASVHAVLYNIDINLGGLKSEERISQIVEKKNHYIESADVYAEVALKAVMDVLDK